MVYFFISIAVIELPQVLLQQGIDELIPLSIVGSLRPIFAPVRWVGLAVKLPSAFALEGQSPSGTRKPLHAFVSFWEDYAL
ncbi:hypothetical protein CJ030_MR8G000123 [Morella rubra]|uniref:Uncharacterized protein n=1 Tax=Morella rubra TaxID=262757 RepID=A0A6A1UQ84_9ROSI|nr:hypothetical protein CJ030_MR8G000123 [Morella rubra]